MESSEEKPISPREQRRQWRKEERVQADIKMSTIASIFGILTILLGAAYTYGELNTRVKGTELAIADIKAEQQKNSAAMDSLRSDVGDLRADVKVLLNIARTERGQERQERAYKR